MAIAHAELEAAAHLIDRTLRPFEEKPKSGEIEEIIADLKRHGDSWFSEVARLDCEDAIRALDEWTALVGAGPSHSPFGLWTHARALARGLRRLHSLLAAGAVA